MGQNADALEPVKNTAALAPHDAKSHYNLGFLYQELGHLGEAEASYRQTLRLNPAYGQAHSNLSVVYQRLGQLEAAEASCKNALGINPNYAEAHNNLGSILLELGRLEEAELSLRSALHLDQNYSAAYGNLGITLQKSGRKEEALACFQQQLQLDPGNAVAQYQIVLLTSSANPERAPDQYVENVFDSYANRFDTHLQQELQYDIPQKILSLITRHSRGGEDLDILDLGCGTGLVGLVIAPFAKQLVGVDLSAKMLEKARARNLYQRLGRSDLLSMMRQEQASSYDMIISADVFVYLGKLDEIIGEVKRLLRPNGVFSFSTESLDVIPDDKTALAEQRQYRLNNTGRYTHSVGYLTELAARFGFEILELSATQIRLEQGKPANGHVGLWVRQE
jgi:predicted TPR repeat methyltransferase